MSTKAKTTNKAVIGVDLLGSTLPGDPNKLYAVTRYLQLRPKDSTVLMSAFKKKYQREAHYIADWDILWENFLNQKV